MCLSLLAKLKCGKEEIGKGRKHVVGLVNPSSCIFHFFTWNLERGDSSASQPLTWLQWGGEGRVSHTKAGAGNSFFPGLPRGCQGPKHLGHLQLFNQVQCSRKAGSYIVGSWNSNQGRMGCWHCRLWLNLLCPITLFLKLIHSVWDPVCYFCV